MRLAILGGSFNPIHVGHLYLADCVLQDFGYDRVILVPAYQSPFKPAADIAPSSQDRLDMICASIAGDSRLGVDDCEIRRQGVSYTIDTLHNIVERYQGAEKPALIIGDDLAGDFPHWKSFDQIIEAAEVIVANRISAGAEKEARPFPCRQLENRLMDVSSRMVRERILQGGAWRSLVPAAARIIIEERGLYREAAPVGEIAPSLIVRIEEEARRRLSVGRFLHSRSTALLASDLCCRWGLDSRAGYLAGIAHDICKGLSEQEMFAAAEKDGAVIGELERRKSGLLHGRAAAVFLREAFGLEREDILEAVRFHTTGRAGMGPLAKILYAADKIEATRAGVDPALRRMACNGGGDLDSLFFRVLESTVSWLKGRDMVVSGGTMELLLQGGGKNDEKNQNR